MRLLALILLPLACSRPPEPPPPEAPASSQANPTAPITAPAPPAASPIPPHTRQLLLGVVEGWDSTAVTLRLYEREPGEAWQLHRGPWPGVVGHAGIAWGRGLHGDGPPPGQSGGRKQEGDGRAPAGAFALRDAYGFADRAPAGTAIGYHAVDESWRCVDDPGSAAYNRIIDLDREAAEFESAEHLHRGGALYEWIVEVAHNQPARPRQGSCIFLHVWRGPDDRTAGCTAMPAHELVAVIAGLDPAAHPVYVLLPAQAYRSLREPWQLPALTR